MATEEAARGEGKPSFRDLGVSELFEHDDRPIFVLDLESPPNSNPVYYNPPLEHNKGLKDRIHGLANLYGLKAAHKNNTDWSFLQWQRKGDIGGHHNSHRYANLSWVATTMRGRWRAISAVFAAQNTHSDGSQMLISSKPRTSKSHSATLGRLSNLTGPITLHHPGRLPESLPNTRRDRREPLSLSDLVGEIGERTTSYDSTILSDVKAIETPSLDRFAARPWTSANTPLNPFDWTVPGCKGDISSYAEWFRNFDWSTSKLGTIETWSSGLRRMVLHLMADPRPSAAYWGRERIMIYNELYRVVVGGKHPFMMGKPFAEAWAELGAAFEPAFNRSEEHGLPARLDDACFFIERADFLEECYFSIAVYPFIGDDYDSVATYNPIFETTRQVIAERRMTFLLNLGSSIGTSKHSEEFWKRLLEGLETAAHEAPFALLYSAVEDSDDDQSRISDGVTSIRSWVLEGSVGYPEDFRHSIRLESKDSHFIPGFDRLLDSSKPTLLKRSDGSLPESLVEGIVSRSFGDRVDHAVFLPIRSAGKTVLAFLILGLDARKAYDTDYQIFIQLLDRQLAANLSSAVLFEDEMRRNRIAAERAALDRNDLSQKLAMRTHEVIESEHRFRRIVELAPVGMFYFAANGMPIYCNNNWYNMTGHPRGAEYPMSWYNVIHEDDLPLMDVEWAKVASGQPVSFELRLKKTFSIAEIVGGEKVSGPTWILAAAYPEIAQDGTVNGILGCLTDISRTKWAEDYQTRRTKEALEIKRQQENFIDMTSHEMRNPLSAILQCADWISTSLREFDLTDKNVTIPSEVVEGHLEAAQTIVLCAQHQKRIIDDVLTLSKLDSNLLTVTPVEVQPSLLIENSLKMFDGELQKADVALSYVVEDSYKEMNINWVKLDPSRVLQIIINLLTNAIKFTQSEQQRRIVVTIGASAHKPTERNGLHYLPRSADHADLTDTPEWGPGSVVYLEVQVEDTGRGLNEHERQLLFQRFSQASPRTHVVYGGSGLGLFVSRELTELQGGEIGVRSESGVGSTFAFFVKARHTPPPGITEDINPTVSHLIDPSAVAVLAENRSVNSIASSHARTQAKSSLKVSQHARHVLVVEDNLVNQKVLSKQLTSAGCVVTVANHGAEALSLLEKSTFWAESAAPELSTTDANTPQSFVPQKLSIILMDLEMPIMDGLTCVREIRRLEAEGKLFGHVPVIAVTANARSEQIRVAKEAGMDGVVTKPFRIPELIPEMERLTGRGSIERSSSAPLTSTN